MTPESIKVGDLVVPHPVLGQRYTTDGHVLTVIQSSYKTAVEHSRRHGFDDIAAFEFYEDGSHHHSYLITCEDSDGKIYQGFHVRFQLAYSEYQLDQQLDEEEDLL